MHETEPSYETVEDPMSFLYEPKPADAPKGLEKQYNPPSRFRHGEWELVAEVMKDEDGYGQNVKMYESRYPSRFYKLVTDGSPDSCGKPVKPFSLSTGSGKEMRDLCAEIAVAISQGMIGIEVLS